MRILLASCLLLAGCSSGVETICLAQGEPARVESIGESIVGRDVGRSAFTVVRFRMNDGTIRACVTTTDYASAYRVGDVVRGPLYDNAFWLPRND